MIYRVRAAEAATGTGKKIELPRLAHGILVHGGGRGVRILLQESHETWIGQRSVEAVTGLCLPRDFDRAWIRAADATEVPDVVFEALDCAPALVASVGRSHIAYRRVFNSVDIPDGDSSPTVTVLVPPESTANLAVGDDRVQPTDAYFIGGGFVSNVPFTLRLYAYVRPGTAFRALIGSIDATVADPSGAFGLTMDTGWRKNNSTLGPLHQVPIPMSLPWELELYQSTGAPGLLNGTVYLRNA